MNEAIRLSPELSRCKNVALLGPSGVGKTHLAIAIGLLATHRAWKVRFISAADLVIALEAAQRQRRMRDVMHRTVAMPKLLIVDEIGYLPFARESRQTCSSRSLHDDTKMDQSS